VLRLPQQSDPLAVVLERRSDFLAGKADVDEGRRVLNFSEWTRGYDEAQESGKTVRNQEMPPRSYLLMHPEARLSDAERQQLASGLDATFDPARSTQRD
jgi:hypothetical protein